MISISNLSIHYANRYLFDNISLTANPSDKIGLIGRNGTGKTTLLKIIAGLETPEEGSIVMPNDFDIGYLPQEGNIDSDKTVFNEAYEALSEVSRLEKDIKEISRLLSERSYYDSKEYMKLIETLSTANERYKTLGGHSIEADIEKVLIGLGFTRNDFSRRVSEFSGGWQMRLELAKILISKPRCILLDEPTNHLDIESIQWLENYLKNYNGSVVIVSHDRRFLDVITNRTIEIIGNGKIFDFNAPYSKFIEIVHEIKQQQLAAQKNQEREIAHIERFIERFKAKATLASRAQSRVKKLEKMIKIENEPEDDTSIRFRFPDAVRAGLVVAEALRLSKSYNSNLVLNKIDFSIGRSEKVAFVGKNGEGKSTFSRILAGEENFTGELKKGYNVQLGYFAQHQAEMLSGEATVFETIDNAATGEMRTQVRNLLGAFLFSGESVFKKVKVLSGGEKSRLAIARLLLQPINFLILDEPTNHLDMVSKDVLKNALLEYQGALIIVSHDREFLNGISEKTVLFKNQKIKEYPGDIYEFLEKEKLESLGELDRLESKESTSEETYTPGKAKLEREQKKLQQREESRLRRLVDLCEEEINRLEKEIKFLEEEFAKPDFYINIESSLNLQKKYDELKNIIAKKMEEWAERQEDLDSFLENNQ